MKKLLPLITLLFIGSLAFSQITITSTVTNVSCFGGSDGNATVSATGGTAPYTYTWTPTATNTPTITGVAAGLYTVTVTDASMSTSSLVVTIGEPTQLNAIVNSNNVRCFGTATGTISVAASGGTSPYSYIWAAPGSTLATVPNVPVGNYGVTVTDANGCVTTNSISVTEPAQLITSVSSQTNVTCFGGVDGGYNILATGGSGSYFFVTDVGSVLSNCTNISAGIHSFTVTDANNCVSTGTVNITQPSQITTIATTTNVSCAGACDGKINTTTVGGTGAYASWVWNIPTALGLPNITNVCSGNWMVTVTDHNGCVGTQSVIITQPTQIMAITTSTNATCGQNNGGLCATISGGSGSLSIAWSTASTSLCNNLIPAGLYTYTVTDSNGCSITSSKIINSIGGPSVSIASQTNVSCFGLSNGGASTSVTGGTAPYNYSWTIGGTQSYISNMPTGIYGVTVTDNLGCVGSQSVVITQPSQLLIYANANPECGGGMCNGSINAMIVGGNAPYAYTWSTGATTTNYLPGLCAGMYSVQVTDMMGCVATQTAFVNQTLPITITPSFTNVSCGGYCDGKASMTVMGGTPVYYFSWSPNIGYASSVSNLCAGTYTFIATDGLGCTGTNVFTISNSSLSSISNATLSSLPTNETCLNSGDGSIDLTITGSNPGPFTYQWNNGATSQDIYNLNSNHYSVVVYDAAMNCLTLQDTVFADGINCGTINGNVFLDNNADCIKNSGDTNFNSALILVNPGSRYGYTNALGNYSINNLPFGTYSVSLVSGGGIYIPTPLCNSSLTSTISAGSLISNANDFSIGYNSITQPDMQVWGYSSPVVPGFVTHLTYQLANLNNVNGTGLFKATLPSVFIPNITAISPASYTISGDTIIWNFNNVTYTSGGTYFGVDFYVPVGTTLGSTFSTCMYAQPNITDLNYVSNDFCYSRTVVGSFDPNDKTVSPVGVGTNGYISATETDLTYLIRFQNTGNGPAINIVVKDTLSPNVDINSFEMLSSSHNYNIDILPGNILRWKFTNIMLADSGSNEPASHGYIQYRIKRTNNNTPGTQIKNTAYIYFDFNAPVVTNTAINTIETVTGIIPQASNANGWNVYPNPSTGALYIVNSSSVKEASQVQVLNSIGQTVLEETITSNYKNIDLSKLINGVYFVKITSDKNSTVKRIILSK